MSYRGTVIDARHAKVNRQAMSAFDTLLSPVILFFVLGALAALARSDLSVPEPIAKGMFIHMLFY